MITAVASAVGHVHFDAFPPGHVDSGQRIALPRYLRESWQGVVIIMSGRGDAVDRVIGLDVGADDYVNKPFDLRELVARVRSILRRARSSASIASPRVDLRYRFANRMPPAAS